MGNGYPAAAFGGRREIMELLPSKVSHGGTYAGNRIAAAAATRTLEIIRGTDAPATGRPPPGPRRRRAGLPDHRPPIDVRDHVHRADAERVPRLGEHGPRALRRD